MLKIKKRDSSFFSSDRKKTAHIQITKKMATFIQRAVGFFAPNLSETHMTPELTQSQIMDPVKKFIETNYPENDFYFQCRQGYLCTRFVVGGDEDEWGAIGKSLDLCRNKRRTNQVRK